MHRVYKSQADHITAQVQHSQNCGSSSSPLTRLKAIKSQLKFGSDYKSPDSLASMLCSINTLEMLKTVNPIVNSQLLGFKFSIKSKVIFIVKSLACVRARLFF